MLIVKMGKEHLDSGINCQDYAIELPKFKMIVDGCSSCKNSEVGAKLFSHLFPKTDFSIDRTFNTLKILYNSDKEILDNLLFTINMVEEEDDYFQVSMCGDGYIIKQRQDGTLEYEKYDYNDMPPYYSYNYITNKKILSKYADGVMFKRMAYLKSEYKNIGVSSDGLRYIINSPYKDEFESTLIRCKETGKVLRLKLFINKHINEFKDDMSIVF